MNLLVRCTVLLLSVVCSVTIALPSSLAASSLNCSVLTRRYMNRTAGSEAALLTLRYRRTVDEVLESARCESHPPSSPEEKLMTTSEYSDHCQRRLDNAVAKRDAAKAALNTFMGGTAVLATKVQELCWKEAVDAALTGSTAASERSSVWVSLEAHVNFLVTTAKEVMLHYWDVYKAGALQDFMNYAESSSREAYRLYLRLRKSHLTPPDVPKPSTATGLVRSLNVLLSAVRSMLPENVVLGCQLVGCLLGPLFVLASISTVVVLVFPVIVGYFVIGELVLRFWVRAILVDSILTSLLEEPALSLSAMRAAWNEYAIEAVVYTAAVTTAAVVCMVLSYPWYSTVLAFLPRRSK